jgi:hypothetical protein
VRRPGDEVDGRGVQGYFVDLRPLVAGLAPDEDLAVVRGGSEDVAVLGVGLDRASQTYVCICD